MTKDKWLGHGAILATNLIFGLNTPIAKTIVPEWISPYALTFVRMVFATLVFWGIGLLAPKEEVGKRDLWTIFWGALFGLVGAQVSFANALLYTSPVNITISHHAARGYADRSPDIKRARHIQKSCRSFDRSIGCLTDHFSIVGYKYRFIRQLDR